jgi:CubicO group peptidase (beta-lactamase class C family)
MFKNKKIVFLFELTVFLIFISGLQAQNAFQTQYFDDSKRLEKIKMTFNLVDSIYKDAAVMNHYPGLSYGIIVDGHLLHKGNFGYIDIRNKIPVTSSSMFRIASMSKNVTAMAVIHLRDQNKINLDDPVEKYIPEMKNQNYLTSDAPLITIRHCLTHSAGFPEDNPWGDRQLQDSDVELAELLQNKVSFSTIPDFTYEYSNLGYALLGRIITVVSGMPYQEYIKKYILNPLQMTNTDWEYNRINKNELALGYRWLDGKYLEEALLHDNPEGSWGAMGSMISSVDEFSKYISTHLTAWPPRSETEAGPVKRNSIREMHKPWNFSNFNPKYKYADGRLCVTANAYGYGLRWTKDCDDKTYIGHSGGLPGFGSHWMVMPEYGIGLVSFANRTYAGTSSINMAVMDAIVKYAGLKPRKIPVSDILKQRQNELLAILPKWENAEKSGIFAENFFPDFILDKLKEQSKEMFSNIGIIKKVHEIVPENNLRGTFIIEGTNGSIQVFFTLTPENPPLIQEFKMIKSK